MHAHNDVYVLTVLAYVMLKCMETTALLCSEILRPSVFYHRQPYCVDKQAGTFRGMKLKLEQPENIYKF